MFRRLSSSLPKDPDIPKDLSALGYFINENDQIRQIKHPDQNYQYQVNRNERVNELHKEAMNCKSSTPCNSHTQLIFTMPACIRTLVLNRLTNLNLSLTRLPLNASPTDRHVPILTSTNLTQTSRIIVLFGERNQDLGIFSYRVTGNESIPAGSAIDFVSAVAQNPNPRGIIITNPGQLLWYRGGGRAITYSEWMSLPRPSAVHDALEMDPEHCTIPGNRDYREHVHYVFEHVMRELVSADTKFELIGLESTGHAMINFLAENWNEWAPLISGICLGSPQHTIKDLLISGDNGNGNGPAFADFISKRCRAYIVSTSDRETFLTGREEYGCNCYASGEQFYQENVVIASWRSMLDWFNLIESSPEYEEVEVVVRHGEEEEEGRGDGWEGDD